MPTPLQMYNNGMTYSQIAKQLCMTIGQVAGRIFRERHPNYEKEYSAGVKLRLQNRSLK